MTINEAEKNAIDSMWQDCSIEELVLDMDDSWTVSQN